MKTLMTTLLRCGAFALASLLTSCQTPAVPDSAVSCNKCGTVYFKAPASTGVGAAGMKSGFMALKPASRMDCPDCENRVITWVKTGSLTKHTCKSCGGTLQHCTKH